MAGVWVVGGVGFVACAFTFLVSLFPPSGTGFPTLGYIAIMIVGTAVLALPPLVFLRFKRPSWAQAGAAASAKEG